MAPPESTPHFATLAAENRRLRAQLADLLAHARHNQQIMQRHQMFDLQFIGAGSFRELIDSLFFTLKEASDLDIVTLVLIDPDCEIRRMLADLGIGLDEYPNLLFVQGESGFGESQAHLQGPVLDCYSEERHGALFPEPLALPASIAIVPLIRNRKRIGCLNFGSFQATRFTPHMATDFIEHMSSIVAICIENVINGERLKHIGLTDPLTGVNNRRYVERRLLEEVGRARRQGHALSCLFIDIDHFKRVNDRMGHQAGDAVLRETAARIKAELRLSDTLGRFGGEEFVALLVDTGLSDAKIVAERIRASIAEQAMKIGASEEISVAVSIGAADLPASDHAETLEAAAQKLVARADQALYRAKAGGRNQVAGAE
ncbi:MAG TPA: sensor domain-containing diguanylate cyclase [Paucimonas sp.]|nr:sensor domain-containing diguanylate cyclase [Paucimonas sp.]HJW53859.1 sensor domain-containing diguanylate cyclase [Burkholderiaceae bacterium]